MTRPVERQSGHQHEPSVATQPSRGYPRPELQSVCENVLVTNLVRSSLS